MIYRKMKLLYPVSFACRYTNGHIAYFAEFAAMFAGHTNCFDTKCFGSSAGIDYTFLVSRSGKTNQYVARATINENLLGKSHIGGDIVGKGSHEGYLTD